jgi:hypothetical protein
MGSWLAVLYRPFSGPTVNLLPSRRGWEKSRPIMLSANMVLAQRGFQWKCEAEHCCFAPINSPPCASHNGAIERGFDSKFAVPEAVQKLRSEREPVPLGLRDLSPQVVTFIENPPFLQGNSLLSEAILSRRSYLGGRGRRRGTRRYQDSLRRR